MPGPTDWHWTPIAAGPRRRISAAWLLRTPARHYATPTAPIDPLPIAALNPDRTTSSDQAQRLRHLPEHAVYVARENDRQRFGERFWTCLRAPGAFHAEPTCPALLRHFGCGRIDSRPIRTGCCPTQALRYLERAFARRQAMTRKGAGTQRRIPRGNGMS